jgi:hypothetical protein
MKTNFEQSPKTVEKWEAMGFHAETVSLLALIPALRVAWAEGFLQTSERRVLLQIFEQLEIPHGKGFHELLGWLDERPSDSFFDSATDILSESLAKTDSKNGAVLRDFLHRSCLKVADASWEIGLKRDSQTICREERQELEKVGARLGFSFA